MATRVKKKAKWVWSKYLPPKDLVQRRLVTLAYLLRKEANEQVAQRRKTGSDRLTPIEMREWADQVERIT